MNLWIFGYGSLVWRPAFAHAERRSACVRGWARRFWQGSTDHRGTPTRPGRVVTLLQVAESVCWGTAYRLDAEGAEQVLEGLDQRERGGYVRHTVELEFSDAGERRASALMYVATPENPNYLGPADLPQIAAQVRDAHGPSGANLEYVVRLARALREMKAEDEHVFALERLLRSP